MTVHSVPECDRILSTINLVDKLQYITEEIIRTSVQWGTDSGGYYLYNDSGIPGSKISWIKLP